MKTLNELLKSGKYLDSYQNFIGSKENHHFFYLYAKTRDSKIIDISNYEVIIKMLDERIEKEDLYNKYPEEEDLYYIESVSHWLVGYMDRILINPIVSELVEIGEKIEKDLEDYPLLDEEDFCNREFEEVCSYWEDLPLQWRIEKCFKNDYSIFSARSSCPPDRIYESISCEI